MEILDYVNLGEVRLYDSAGELIPSDLLTAALSSSVPDFPVSNCFDGGCSGGLAVPCTLSCTLSMLPVREGRIHSLAHNLGIGIGRLHPGDDNTICHTDAWAESDAFLHIEYPCANGKTSLSKAGARKTAPTKGRRSLATSTPRGWRCTGALLAGTLRMLGLGPELLLAAPARRWRWSTARTAAASA
jgi:hypothetical protein